MATGLLKMEEEKKISMKEFYVAMGGMKSKKAPRHDRFTTKMIKTWNLWLLSPINIT